jgi:hypothetical protein
MSIEQHFNITSRVFPEPASAGLVPDIRKKDPYIQKIYANQSQPPHLFGSSLRKELVGKIHSSTPLNEQFFSQSNIEYLQTEIQNQVFAMCGKSIGRQSDIQLELIMRSYYLTYSNNNASQVKQELDDLNARVIAFAATRIYSEVDFHEYYLDDLQNGIMPIANPTNVKVYGTHRDEFKSFF